MKPLYRLTPHRKLVNNPLFNFEVRRVGWGCDARRLLIYSGRRVGIICAAVTAVWLFSSIRSPFVYYRYGNDDFIWLLLAISLLAGLALDYASMAAALGSINGEVAAGRWDLLRLTSLRTEQIVAAKHGAAQVRAWRIMILIVALRLAVTLTLLLNSLVYLSRPGQSPYYTSGQVLTSLIGQLIIIVTCIIYVIEPLWRMRTMTALGVAISARARQQTSAVLSAVGAVAGLWLAQGFVIGALALAISFVLVPLAVVEVSVNQIVIFSPLLLIGIFVITVYGFYALIQTWSLRRAERWIGQTNA